MPHDVHHDVLDGLGRRIASGALPPGTTVTLAHLEEEYGASRTVVREAVRMLEGIRLVQSKRRVGITVRPRSEWNAFDTRLIHWMLQSPFRQQQLESLMELRVAVEPISARLSAERADMDQRADIVRLAQELKALGKSGRGDSQEYLDVDIAFHCLLLTASGNPLLHALDVPIREVLTGRSHLGLTPPVPYPGTLDDHVDTADAVMRGDADAAEEHSRTHLRTVWGEITSR